MEFHHSCMCCGGSSPASAHNDCNRMYEPHCQNDGQEVLTLHRVKALTRSRNQGNVWAAWKSLGTPLLVVHSADSGSGILKHKRISSNVMFLCLSESLSFLITLQIFYVFSRNLTYTSYRWRLPHACILAQSVIPMWARANSWDENITDVTLV
jgi:hypothetical protein